MKTVAKLNFERKRAGLPLIRFDLVRLNPDDVQDLRDAYAAMYEISDIAIGDKRGYAAYARGHGYDQDLCHTDDRLFLTWHRSYIYSFEKALNSALQWKRGDRDLELTLPFWDWTTAKSSTHAANGLPKVLDDPTYKDTAGATVDNPLARAKSLYRTISQGLSGADEFTQRFPKRFKNGIGQLKADVATYLTNPSFTTFQQDFNFNAHGAVHVDVGGADRSSPLPGNAGDMARVISAAFDPVFWLRHCMVDKVWFDWQLLHPNANVPTHVVNSVVYDGRVGADLIDAENSLKYIYSVDSVQAAVAASGLPPEANKTLTAARSGSVREISLGEVEGGFARAQLDFVRLHPPKASFEVRAFISNPHANVETSFEDESFAGRMVLFGHGECHGAPGHCNPALSERDEYDQRPKHPLRFEHTRYTMDVTRGLRRHMGRKKSQKDVRLYLIFLDDLGNEVSPDAVKYDGCSLRTFASN